MRAGEITPLYGFIAIYTDKREPELAFFGAQTHHDGLLLATLSQGLMLRDTV